MPSCQYQMLTLLLFSAATLATGHSTFLSQRQYDPSSEINCKEISLTQPEWYLYDPSFTIFTGGTTGDVGFAAYNVATNVTFDCYARGVDLALPVNRTEWHNCGIPNTQFSFSELSNSFGLRGSWICNDAPDLTFVANGSVELPEALGCNTEAAQRWCLYGNNAINPALSSPVNIKPFPAWYPRTPYEYPERCVERSDYPTWELHDFVYNHTGNEQSVSLTVINIMNGARQSCLLTTNEAQSRASAHAPRWMDCTGASQPGSEVSGTQIQFDHDYGLLGIRQSWKCHDNVASNDEPDTYTGLGYLVTPLDCTRPVTHNGEGISDASTYTCSLPTRNISGYAAYDFPPRMPHTSYTHSCTMNSINSTGFILQHYEVITDPDKKKPDMATFKVYNPGPGDTYRIQNVTVEGDGLWHKCQGSQDTLPWQLFDCEYLFDPSTSRLGVQFQWYCDDRDPYNAIIFSTNATGKLPSGTSDMATLNISSVSWKSTGSSMKRGPELPWV
ncbi:hypothetical protein GE09DRAFT_1289451 [Coniochaeta sp. 2T2.1]|nr:hypothetical protein GE09DRAFT_1289451 [Coniochaeta sp. 2T2.1]